jgi:hypothetical protein
MGITLRLTTYAIAILSSALTYGQATGPGQVVRATVVDGDTIASIQLPEARVNGRWKPRDRKEAARYDKLTRNVVKVYPYARLTGELLREYEHDLSSISKEGDQELYIKLAEAELRAEFEAEVKDLTMSQGRVLIKLIDRETGKTSYDLVKDLRGSFQAFVWQGLARLFGQDLRSDYDPNGEDKLVEVIVQRIEHGELPVAARQARTEKAQAKLEKRKARLYKKYGLLPTVASTGTQ